MFQTQKGRERGEVHTQPVTFLRLAHLLGQHKGNNDDRLMVQKRPAGLNAKPRHPYHAS